MVTPKVLFCFLCLNFLNSRRHAYKSAPWYPPAPAGGGKHLLARGMKGHAGASAQFREVALCLEPRLVGMRRGLHYGYKLKEIADHHGMHYITA